MGVFETLFTNGPLGCAQDFGTAYVYGSGNQSSSNNYNISPGQPNSAWRVPRHAGRLQHPVRGRRRRPERFRDPRGPSLGPDRSTTASTPRREIRHPAGRRRGPATSSRPRYRRTAPAASTGPTCWAASGGPVTLSYSADGGKSWSSGTLDSDSDSGVASLNSASTPPARGGRPGSTTARCSRSRSRPPTRSRPRRWVAAPRPTGRRSTAQRHLRVVPVHDDDRADGSGDGRSFTPPRRACALEEAQEGQAPDGHARKGQVHDQVQGLAQARRQAVARGQEVRALALGPRQDRRQGHRAARQGDDADARAQDREVRRHHKK